ncbi:MAG: thioredoxin family protein [Halobacteriota archaeon]
MMMGKLKIEVLGPGCPKCRATKKLVEEVIRDLQVNAEVVEVSDIDEIIDRGVMVTPAVFVDDELKSTGKVPLKEEIERWISGETGKNKVEEQCACLYYLQEQARTTKKESSLYRVKCKGCGREFLSNTGKEYCFDCEEKK